MTAAEMTAAIIKIANESDCDAMGGTDYACITIPGGIVVEVNIITSESGDALACGEVDHHEVGHFFDVIKGEAPADFVARIKACPVSLPSYYFRSKAI